MCENEGLLYDLVQNEKTKKKNTLCTSKLKLNTTYSHSLYTTVGTKMQYTLTDFAPRYCKVSNI